MPCQRARRRLRPTVRKFLDMAKETHEFYPTTVAFGSHRLTSGQMSSTKYATEFLAMHFEVRLPIVGTEKAYAGIDR